MINPDTVISVGGDGTLLSAFHHYEKIVDQIRFTAVNTGHVGFYTDWRTNEVDQLVTSLQQDHGKSILYPLLEVIVHFNDPYKKTGVHLALMKLLYKK